MILALITFQLSSSSYQIREKHSNQSCCGWKALLRSCYYSCLIFNIIDSTWSIQPSTWHKHFPSKVILYLNRPTFNNLHDLTKWHWMFGGCKAENIRTIVALLLYLRDMTILFRVYLEGLILYLMVWHYVLGSIYGKVHLRCKYWEFWRARGQVYNIIFQGCVGVICLRVDMKSSEQIWWQFWWVRKVPQGEVKQ